MVEEVNWGPGPIRISSLTAMTGVLLMVLAATLGLAGAGILALALFVIAPEVPHDGPDFDYWWGLSITAIVGGGLLFFGIGSWRTGRTRTSLSVQEGEVKLIDADILSVSPAGRGMSVFRYAFTQDGLRWTAEQTFHGDPLFLDDLASRGVALSLAGGTSELLGPSARQMILEPAERARVLAEVAALVARRSVVEPDIRLLEDMVEGREKKFVRHFREACQTDDPTRRRKLAHDRLFLARRLKGERADTLLQQCRVYFDPPPSPG